jgi:hypothetical protein
MVRPSLPALVVALGVAVMSSAQAPPQPAPGPPPRALAQALQTIYRLDGYTVFDWISGRYDRGTLMLQGFVRSPSLKKAAEAAGRKVPGVEEVKNDIEVLPALSTDDDVRVRAFAAIYTSSLERYAPGGHLTDSQINDLADVGRLGLDASDVGRGPHGIHIVVSGGRVLLLGEVRATGDRQQAEGHVRGLLGVMSVVNQLRVGK